MKTSMLGFRAFLLVLLGLAWSTGWGATTIKPPCCSGTESASAPMSDKSLYQVDSTWTTDTGKKIKLADLKGRPQVVVMFFANCQMACPILVNDLKRIEAALKPEQRSQVGFTLITFDPRRDTPEALAKYRSMRGLPAATWTLLRGEPDDIRELAALLGLKYKEQATGQFAHSNLITLLNSQGEIVSQITGLSQDINPMGKAIGELLGNDVAVK